MKAFHFVFWKILLLMVACSTPSPEPLLPVSIHFIEPSKHLLINKDVFIALDSNRIDLAIELYLDNQLLTILQEPYLYTWNISSWSDGIYTLEARVKLSEQVFKSETRIITLDRTAPKIVDRKPSPEATNVWLADSIEIQFSEAINKDLVTQSQIVLGDAQGQNLDISTSLTDTRVIVKLNETPVLPTTLSLSLPELSDRAGNVFQQTSWSWSVPKWQHLGDSLNVDLSLSASDVSMMLDSKGNPIVAWEEATNIYVKHWLNQRWQTVGTKLNHDPARNPSLAVYVDLVFVAWAEGDSQSDIYVNRWNGSSWESLGDTLDSVAEHDTAQPSLVIDSQGNPVVTWFEFDGHSSNIYVKRWNGFAWEPLGDALDITLDQNAVFPSTALADTTPIVTWFERNGQNAFVYVKRWNGNDWVSLGEALNMHSSQGYNPTITSDTSGTPYVTWFEFNGHDYSVYVTRWDGTKWELLGDVLDLNPSKDAAYPVIICRNDHLLVSWFEMGETVDDIYIKEWKNDSWKSLHAPKVSNATYASYPSLGLDSQGYPVLAWRESGKYGQDSRVYVQRSNYALGQPVQKSSRH